MAALRASLATKDKAPAKAEPKSKAAKPTKPTKPAATAELKSRKAG
jgi:hypothetical protein